MGAPLYDITIYYSGDIIEDTPKDWAFRKTLNFISDYYHYNLNGYKPVKTARICITFVRYKQMKLPSYFGSICSFDTIFDEEKYLRLEKKEKYSYVLDLLHSTILEISDYFKWDNEIFENSYKQILLNDFKFEKTFPENISRDKKNKVQLILTKTEENSTITIFIKSEKQVENIILIEKKNHFWYDSIYKYVKKCRWLDNDSFGIKEGSAKLYYSISNYKVVNENFQINRI